MAPRKPAPEPVRRVRCAIYTRKSDEEGLEQEFNSLDAQREAAEDYIASQRGQGWVALDARYDDPARSAATMDRPALRRLLADVEAGRVDAVVVYKIDRLSRSLRDFVQLIQTFEDHDVSFVSVTQRFDTSTSMGKLTLNILMSFAEFEREVTRERIRDKIAAAKRRGLHCGGVPVLGYNLRDKKLVVNEAEAKLVRRVFERFCALGSATALMAELNREGHRTKVLTSAKGVRRGGQRWNKAHVYRLLSNPTYIGEVAHDGKTYAGQHEAIVPRSLWEEAHRILTVNYRARANRARARTPALLKGLIRCAHCGKSMGPTFTRRRGKTYRYYLCVGAGKNGYASCPVRSVAAGEVERAVIDQLRAVFRSPEVVARTAREAGALAGAERDRLKREEADLRDKLRLLRQRVARLVDAKGYDAGAIAEALRQAGDEADEAEERLRSVTADLRGLEAGVPAERDVAAALRRLDPVWAELFPAERARIVQLLVERVDVHADGLEVRLRAEGLESLVAELSSSGEAPR